MRHRHFVALWLLCGMLGSSGCTNSEATSGSQGVERVVKGGPALVRTFDKEEIGAVPAGAQVFSGTWAISAEADAPSPPHVLCQTARAPFPALALSDKVFADFVMTTSFKPVSGSEDRAAGIIFRIKDNANFYILRANALEDNVNLYKYVNGSRILVKGGDAKVPSGKWQELQVAVTGSTIRGFLNGKMVVSASDSTFSAGKVGLWTKADSVTCFDDVRITAQ